MLTIVLPVFNEAGIIEAVLREWHEAVIAKIPNSEIVVVDDASTDGTDLILRDLSQALPHLRVLRAPYNRGHGPSVLTGIRDSQKEYVFYTDSDGQFSVSEFWKFWDLRNDFDLVIGVRTQREDGVGRWVVTNGLRLMILLTWGLWIRDANCAFKLLKRKRALELMSDIPEDAFFPMTFVVILATRLKLKIAALPVLQLPRRGGASSLKGLSRWVRIIPRCMKEMVLLRKQIPKTH